MYDIVCAQFSNDTIRMCGMCILLYFSIIIILEFIEVKVEAS